MFVTHRRPMNITSRSVSCKDRIVFSADHRWCLVFDFEKMKPTGISPQRAPLPLPISLSLSLGFVYHSIALIFSIFFFVFRYISVSVSSTSKSSTMPLYFCFLIPTTYSFYLSVSYNFVRFSLCVLINSLSTHLQTVFLNPSVLSNT